MLQRLVRQRAPWRLQALAFTVVGSAYIALGLLGAVEVSGRLALTALWLPAAIGPATIARWPSLWPAVLAAIVVGETTIDLAVYASSAQETAVWVAGNVLGAIAGAYLLLRLDAVILTRPGQLPALCVSGLVAGATFAIVGIFAVPGQITLSSVVPLTAGDTAGFILMAPALLTVGRESLLPRRLRIMVVVSVVVAASAVFLSPAWPAGRLDAWQALLFVSLFFASIGFGLEVVSLAVPALVLIAFWGTGAGRGPFASADQPSSASLLQTQLFVVVVTLALYSGAMLWDQYRRTAKDQAKSRALLASVIGGLPARVSIRELHPGDGEGSAAARPVETVATGDSRYERVHRFVVSDGEAQPWASVEVAFDVTSEHVREAQMRAMFERSPVALVRVSTAGTVLEANTAFATLAGSSVERLAGARLEDLTRPADGDVRPSGFYDSREPEPDVQLTRPDGTAVWVSMGSTWFPGTPTTEPFHLISFDDVTARRGQAQALRHRALHDQLTGLPNREALMRSLGVAMSGAAGRVNLLFCDLDELKRVNDTLGHAVGDQLLVQVARRLVECAPFDATVTRFGGDEFVVALVDADDETVMGCCRQVRQRLREPLVVQGRDLSPTVSIGVATSAAPHDLSPSDLIRRADLAMYEAKAAGRDRVVEYSSEMELRAHRSLEIGARLREALGAGGLRAHLQQIVQTSDRRLVDVEVLARLEGSPAVPPSDFIGVAESMGLMSQLSRAVTDDAFRCLGPLLERTTVGVSLNGSPREVARGSYAGWLLARLAAHDVDPRRVTLEITESVALDSSGPVRVVVEQLRSEGLSIAIDDFGTGYSSLSALRDLPIDVVKLDRSFVAGLPVQRDSLAICRGVVTVAHEMGIIVVGEGVETADQYDCLVELGCDRVQGYAIHRPAPASEVVDHVVAGLDGIDSRPR